MLHKLFFIPILISTVYASFVTSPTNSLEMSDENSRGLLISAQGHIVREFQNHQTFLKIGHKLKTGDKIRTRPNSSAVLVLKSNSILILGPKTSLTIGNHGPDQLQHIHVHEGRLHMQKRPQMKDHPHGTLFTFNDDPHAYLSESFELTLTSDQKTLVLLEGKLKKISLSNVLNQRNDDKKTENLVLSPLKF